MPFRVQPPRDRKLYRLVKRAPVRRVRRGTSFYAPGSEAAEVLLVREGYVRLVLPAMEQGREPRTSGLALPWEFFGTEALTGGLRRYGAVAGPRCAVQALPAPDVLAALRTARKTLDAYLFGTERDLHLLRHSRSGSRGPSARQRLAEVLLDLGERSGDRTGRGVRLGVRPTHQVLADLAGAHRATVTTVINEWLYEGILSDRDGNLTLSRPSALWRLAGYAEEGRSVDRSGSHL